MVGCVAVWQAAKKALSHSPYVTRFPSASAVLHLQTLSRRLKLQPVDDYYYSFIDETELEHVPHQHHM